MQLKIIDPRGPEWVNIKTAIEKEIESLHRTLEIGGTSQTETEYMRGRIAAFRFILAAEKTPEAMPKPAPGYELYR